MLTLVVGVFWHELFFWLGSDTAALLWLRLLLMALAIGWAVLFFDAWRLGQPLTLSMGHRRAAIGINGVLALSVAGALLFGAHLVGVQRALHPRRCSAAARSPAPTTAATTCCCSAATPAPAAGACAPTR